MQLSWVNVIVIGIGVSMGPALLPAEAQSASTATGRPKSFEVASIRPDRSGNEITYFRVLPSGRLSAMGVTVEGLIEFGYDLKSFQVSGRPSWIDSDRYDIEAKVADFQPDPQDDQIRAMIRSLLTDRFSLTLSHHPKALPVYSLVVEKNGPRFDHIVAHTADSPEQSEGPKASRTSMQVRNGELTMTGLPMQALANELSLQVGRQVLDETNLSDKYDLVLRWTADRDKTPMPNDQEPAGDVDEEPSIFTALKEQLGLKLESKKTSVEVIVIEHVNKPTQN